MSMIDRDLRPDAGPAGTASALLTIDLAALAENYRLLAARVLDASRGAVRLQTGYVYHYALAMLLGVVALATWFMVSGGAP